MHFYNNEQPLNYQHNNFQVFSNTQNFISKLNHLSPKSAHPQQLMLFLLNHNFSRQQCQNITQSQSKKQKLQSQITHLRNKISTIIKSNENVIALLQQRDEKATIIEKLLNQRKTTELKAQLQTFRTKHKFKDYLMKEISHTVIPPKRVTIKENLRFYKVANRELKDRIKQLKEKCDKIQRNNKILFEQRQVEEKVKMINCDAMRLRTNQAFCNNNQQINETVYTNRQQSDLWIQKIEQLKHRHLRPKKQSEKLQIYKSAKALQSSLIKTPTHYHIKQPPTNIYSSRFWSNTLREHNSRDKQNTVRKSISCDSNSQDKRSIYCGNSRNKISFANEGNEGKRSLSRVKSLGRVDTTGGSSSVYSYRRIYR